MKVFAKWWKWKSSSFLFHSYHDWNKSQVLLWWLHLTGISSIILYSQCPEFWQKHENTIWRKRARLASWLGAHQVDHSDQLSIKYQGTGVEKVFIPVLTVDRCQADIVWWPDWQPSCRPAVHSGSLCHTDGQIGIKSWRSAVQLQCLLSPARYTIIMLKVRPEALSSPASQ